GKFIGQLFLVPGLIVGLLVLLLLFVGWLAGTFFGGLTGAAHTPDQFLQRLDDPNPDVRWRAAEALAQVLLRDEELASNPKFSLDLADRLRNALKDNEETEAAQQQKPEDQRDRKTLEAQRDYILYLSACLGNMTVPAGAPSLKQMAV